jgi:hypothetical protein
MCELLCIGTLFAVLVVAGFIEKESRKRERFILDPFSESERAIARCKQQRYRQCHAWPTHHTLAIKSLLLAVGSVVLSGAVMVAAYLGGLL